MTRGGVPNWQVAAAAFFSGLGLLLAWEWQQVPQPDPEPYPAVSAGTPTGYHALTRTEIMLAAAGEILN
jgi:hypothetical protein